MKRIHLVLLLLVIVAGVTAWWWNHRTPQLSEQQWLGQVTKALQAGQLDEAAEQGAHALDQFPNSSSLRWLISRVYYQRNELDKALGILLPVVDRPGPEQSRILFAAGELEINLGRSDDAERHLRQHIELDPQQRLAWQRLAYLLTIQGRGQEAVPWRLKSLQTGDFTITDLLFMGNPEAIAVVSQLDQFRNNNPQHPTVLFSKALVHIRENQLVAARELLEKAGYSLSDAGSVSYQSPGDLPGERSRGRALLPPQVTRSRVGRR